MLCWGGDLCFKFLDHEASVFQFLKPMNLCIHVSATVHVWKSDTLVLKACSRCLNSAEVFYHPKFLVQPFYVWCI